MAYVKLNKTGCGERKGNVQIRLDFYLEPTDPRYNGLFIDGQATPFHSHFVYFDPDFTEDDIKAEMDFHLPNFYKAYQNRWDEIKSGMRHGFAVEKRVRPTDYSQNPERVRGSKSAVAKLTEFSYKPTMGVGEEFPATEIDIGSTATDRDSSFGYSFTYIDKANPANDTGTIDTIEIWALSTMSGTNKVGTFHGSGTDYTNRDGEAIGTVTSGSKQTFSGLDIDVTSGDFAGMYWSAGSLERDTTGGVAVYRVLGDQFGTGQQAYVSLGDAVFSLYGTGETPTVGFTPKIIGII